ncbi:MAG: hypothetical protein HDQ96_04650 [Lachnospiraceae bacterium]|nr:hypothetical protein [Lachnospiraceae bacterium]
MKLKEVSQLVVGEVSLYEEAEKGSECNFRDIFAGDCGDIPEEMLEREIVIMSASTNGRMLDIKLKKQ